MLVDSEVVDLLSRITGQKLSQQELTSPVIFLAAMVTVVSGVIYVDGLVTDEEKQRLQATLNRFVHTDGVLQFTQLMVRGVRQQQLYKKPNELVKLAAPLSESQKLLLIGYGYEMSAADGDMHAREKKYLQIIANHLGIDPRYLAVLEASFTHQGNIDPTALDEVQSLLEPAQFYELGTIFVKAASDLLAALPTKPEHKATQQHRSSSYEQLKEFQKSRRRLDNLCYQLYQIVKDCADSEFLPHTLPEEIGKVSQKLQSQRFRLAVVGEFSQGKSTLLNALLGEEIQPVRAVPCSGTVTVLRYGAQKRVVCRYKNGREEEIPFEQYKAKAAISKEAALAHRSDELERFDIDEIIFEHPDLDLCKSGVEILDSPGLNEHPERTAITQKLLKDTDAAIFLTNAMRLLPEKEKELLQDVKNQLNGGRENEPAENLFVLVNFMDSLDEEEDRLDVRRRLESFVKDKNPLIAGENRIHYISAKATLKAILNKNESDYLKSFQKFTRSVESFLAVERGSLENKKAVTKINELVQLTINKIQQAKKDLDGKIKISEVTKQKILEQIGEASGCDVRIHMLVKQMRDEAIEESIKSFYQWSGNLNNKMKEQSKQWHSEHSHLWSQDKLIRDYADQFIRDLQREIDNWGNKQLSEVILKPKLELLNKGIRQELEGLQQNFNLLDQQINADFSQQATFKISGISDEHTGAGGFMGGIGAGGALAAGLLAFTGIGLIPVIIAAVATAIASGFGLGLLDVDGIHDQIKTKVLEQGFEKFKASKDKTYESLDEIIVSAFKSRLEASDVAIKQLISSYENILERHEKSHKETVEQREAEKAWITQKRQEIEQMQNRIEAILS